MTDPQVQLAERIAGIDVSDDADIANMIDLVSARHNVLPMQTRSDTPSASSRHRVPNDTRGLERNRHGVRRDAAQLQGSAAAYLRPGNTDRRQ